MKLKMFLVGGALCFFGACSFKSKEMTDESKENAYAQELEIKANNDSDGDLMNDLDEKLNGRNPFIAEFPELKINFLQNYKIIINYSKKEEEDIHLFIMDTKTKDTDPDYKFRVGEKFARTLAYQKAASFGKFSSHVVGEISRRDYSWIRYPEIEPKLFNQKAMEFREILDGDYEIKSIDIVLSNSAKLEESHLFKSLKNLKLNFYYYDYETENYELLKSELVERHFQGGIIEKFNVELKNVPLNLLKEGFFKRGEFIISEIEDYEIPDLGISLKSLESSIKAKTVPVLFETPLESKLYYVATTEKGIHFHNILKVIFDRNYKIENDELKQIGQFSNNLASFTHLKEVKDKNKFGKWFVMTNELRKPYLDHSFISNDGIIIAYLTGLELGTQKEEKVYSYQKEVRPNQNEMIASLGNVSPNSRINFQLKPMARYGRELTKFIEKWEKGSNSCGKNCVQFPVSCTWEINQYKDYLESFKFNSQLSHEGEQIDLVINGEAFSLKELVKDHKVLIAQVDDGIHLQINDINLIKELRDFEENSLSLRVRAVIENDFFGVKLTEMGGIWNGVGGCPFNTPSVAEKFKTQISKESKALDEISWLVQDLAKRNYSYKFELLDSGPYYKEFSFGVSSVIENFYN